MTTTIIIIIITIIIIIIIQTTTTTISSIPRAITTQPHLVVMAPGMTMAGIVI